MAYLAPFGMVAPAKPKVAKRTWTQAQVDASIAANPNAAGNPTGMYPMFSGVTTPGDTGGGGGVTPGATPPPVDYRSLISSDEIWKQLQAQLAALGIENTNTRNLAFTRGITQAGYTLDPNQVFSSLGIDSSSPGAQAILSVLGQANPLAEQNTAAGLSAKARIDQQNKLAVRQLVDRLGAQGLSRSGTMEKKQGEQSTAYQQSNYDTMQSVLDYLSGAQQAYVQAERDRNNQYITGLNDATMRQWQMANALGLGGQAPTPMPLGPAGVPVNQPGFNPRFQQPIPWASGAVSTGTTAGGAPTYPTVPTNYGAPPSPTNPYPYGGWMPSPTGGVTARPDYVMPKPPVAAPTYDPYTRIPY